MQMDEVVDGGVDGDEDDVKSFQDPSSGVVNPLGEFLHRIFFGGQVFVVSGGSECRLSLWYSQGKSI